MPDQPPKDPKDTKAILAWLMRIQGMEDRSEEWMTEINKKDRRPHEAPKAKDDPKEPAN
jgi:hypothetical protein